MKSQLPVNRLSKFKTRRHVVYKNLSPPTQNPKHYFRFSFYIESCKITNKTLKHHHSVIKTPETYHNLISPVNRRQSTTEFEPQPKVMLTDYNTIGITNVLTKLASADPVLKQRGLSRHIRQFNIHFNIQVPIWLLLVSSHVLWLISSTNVIRATIRSTPLPQVYTRACKMTTKRR